MSDSMQPHRRQPTRLPHLWDSPGKNTGVGCHFLLQCMEVKSESEAAQSFPTLSDPMDCSLPGSSIHVIFQARILEWGDIASFHYFLEYFNRKSRHTDSLKENHWRRKVKWLTSNSFFKSLIEKSHQKNQQGNRRPKLYKRLYNFKVLGVYRKHDPIIE